VCLRAKSASSRSCARCGAFEPGLEVFFVERVNREHRSWCGMRGTWQQHNSRVGAVCTSPTTQQQQPSAPCQPATVCPNPFQPFSPLPPAVVPLFDRAASSAPLTQMGCAWVRSLSKQATSPHGWARWC
jgi:hypothetical protein